MLQAARAKPAATDNSSVSALANLEVLPGKADKSEKKEVEISTSAASAWGQVAAADVDKPVAPNASAPRSAEEEKVWSAYQEKQALNAQREKERQAHEDKLRREKEAEAAARAAAEAKRAEESAAQVQAAHEAQRNKAEEAERERQKLMAAARAEREQHAGTLNFEEQHEAMEDDDFADDGFGDE
eukprot:TRINITY_DN1085_c0_g1_i2.p1 TRINITY_DN1085_c0_g1~~TRINITY_DN1085_c0_g1_i2.p1  ORF type:complete len:185 (-),score=60.52 TRINITY_DN1085_c0_g1_i2:306-860(-)